MTARISVLLPVRNGASTIGAAVRSTLRALPPRTEVLVWDDGSEDGTREVLSRIRDPRLTVLGEGRSVGVAGGLNRLLEVAEAPLVARIDADDISLPGRFRSQVRAIRDGADVSFCGHLRFGPSVGSFRQKRPWALSPATVKVWLALENPLLHPAMLGRTDVIRATGGYRPGPAEDYDLWLRLGARGVPISRTARPGILYRMHGGQVTMKPSYLASLLADTSLREAHDAHAASLGWAGGSVWPFLWVPAVDPEDERRKGAYFAFLDERAAALPAFERHLLRDALRRTRPGSTAPGFTAAQAPG